MLVQCQNPDTQCCCSQFAPIVLCWRLRQKQLRRETVRSQKQHGVKQEKESSVGNIRAELFNVGKSLSKM